MDVVFDVTSPDSAVQAAAVKHIKFMSQAYPESNFVLVIYSGSYPMVLKDRSTVANEVEFLIDQKNVKFKICSMTLNKHKLNESSLIAGVGTVPDGIMEIVMKQREGWSYIKEAHGIKSDWLF